MPMNPADMFFGVVQLIIAALMILNKNDFGIPSGIIYFLVIMLLISAVWDLFD